MFTGIISERGILREVAEISGGERISIVNDCLASTAKPGDSIAVDGCCLTVVKHTAARDGLLTFELSPETLGRTIAGVYRPGAPVNLEPSLKMGDAVGGHLVTGHVDTVGKVAGIRHSGGFVDLDVEVEGVSRGLIAEKGSVSVNGVSLTVAAWAPLAGGGRFRAALIPETLARTNLGNLKENDGVNVEYDLIARYVVETLAGRTPVVPGE